MAIGSVAILYFVVTRIPVDYLSCPESASANFRDQHPVLRVLIIVAKNILGWLFIAAGIVMLITPGQGVLSIALGIMMIDIPGKQRLVRRMAARRGVLQALNRIREKAGYPPLESPKD